MTTNALEVRGLCKTYPAFRLKNVSFSVAPGEIMGMIGRNGAGKSTTLKSILGLVHPEAGEVRMFGEDFRKEEMALKQRLGFVPGGFDSYPKKKLGTIAGVVRRFYRDWEPDTWQRLCRRFALDENKTPDQLSAGMKVKLSIALALSHKAELLILDEPTSGLDPVSREDLLELFLQLCDEGASLLFSTHITSDLEKCASGITYIRDGEIVESGPMDEFVARYRLISAPALPDHPAILGTRRSRSGSTGLVTAESLSSLPEALRSTAVPAGLEDIMVHFEREVNQDA